MKVEKISLGSNLMLKYIDFINKYRGHVTDENAFKWQFSYKAANNVVLGLIKEDSVLGTQCMMPFDIKYKPNDYLSGKCENSYLDESLRGKGEFTKLFDHATDLCEQNKLKLLWAFTPALKPYSRLGFTVYKNCLRQTFLWLIRPSVGSYFNKRKGKQKLRGIASYAVLSNSILKVNNFVKSNKNSKVVVSNTAKGENDIVSMQSTISADFPGLHQLNFTAEFIDWRVRKNPSVDHKEMFFYSENNLVGHLVYSVNKERRAHLKSFIYTQESLLNDVLATLLVQLKAENIESLIFQGNYENVLNKRMFDLLAKLNGRSIPEEGWNFVYKYKPEQESESIKQENLLINYLWTEGYE